MRTVAILLAAGWMAHACAKVEPLSCPVEITGAARLALVITPDMDSVTATLSVFERAPAALWRRVSGPEPAVVGEKGIAWGLGFREFALPGEPVKEEGDKRTPAGVYPLAETFGFEPFQAPGHMTLMPDQHFCVDDLRSEHYGRIVPRTVAGSDTSGERMSEIAVYRRGIVVAYPADSAQRSGSCIFVHVWSSASEGTSGCVALAEDSVARLQEWRAGGDAVIAILPEAAAARLKGCLPE